MFLQVVERVKDVFCTYFKVFHSAHTKSRFRAVFFSITSMK